MTNQPRTFLFNAKRQEKAPICLFQYLKQFPQIRKARKLNIIKELNLNPYTPYNQFNSKQLQGLHSKIEFKNNKDALNDYQLKRKLILKKLKEIGLLRAIRVSSGLPIKGRTHSNGKTARRALRRTLINTK